MIADDHIPGISATKSTFILIEYPAVIKNPDRALATLGGLNSIAQATVTSSPLQLRYNVDNVYQSGVIADKKVVDDNLSGQVRLVVRVWRRKHRNAGINSNDATTKSRIVKMQCIGLTYMAFSFKSMCDFHYLPIRRIGEERNLYEDLVSRLVPNTFISAISWFESLGSDVPKEGDTPYFLPPSQYSRYMTPSTKIFGSGGDGDRHATATDSAVDSGDLSNPASQRKSIGHGKNLRCERKAHTVTVTGSDPFPEAPTNAAIKDVEIRVKQEGPHEMLTQMFTERPLWTRAAILQKTDLDDNVLKVILAKYAFYITSGPWGRCWCKFGYDPRLDPNAKQFQTIMVSFRDHKNIPERQRLKMSLGGVTATPNGSGPRELNQIIDFTYRPGVLPPVRQMWYCVCDILLPAAQKVMRKDFFAVLKQCHESHGWLPAEIINSIRSAIKQDVQRITHLLESSEDYITGSGGNNESDVQLQSLHNLDGDSIMLNDDSSLYDDE